MNFKICFENCLKKDIIITLHNSFAEYPQQGEMSCKLLLKILIYMNNLRKYMFSSFLASFWNTWDHFPCFYFNNG